MEQIDGNRRVRRQRARIHVGMIQAQLSIRFEFGVAQRPLETDCIHDAAGDLEIHLHIDIRGAGMLKRSARAEQLGNEAADQDELGARSVQRDLEDSVAAEPGAQSIGSD